MLISSKLPKFYWAEAVNTGCYLINRCMIRSVLNKTPYELLKGRKQNLAHLRAFGCVCFIHNNDKDNLGKFDAKSDEGIFLGYSLQSKAYKVLNKRTNHVEESVHVVFIENSSEVENSKMNSMKEPALGYLNEKYGKKNSYPPIKHLK